jgi:hypothetical protein
LRAELLALQDAGTTDPGGTGPTGKNTL